MIFLFFLLCIVTDPSICMEVESIRISIGEVFRAIFVNLLSTHSEMAH